jgi:hypothetical protein
MHEQVYVKLRSYLYHEVDGKQQFIDDLDVYNKTVNGIWFLENDDDFNTYPELVTEKDSIVLLNFVVPAAGVFKVKARSDYDSHTDKVIGNFSSFRDALSLAYSYRNPRDKYELQTYRNSLPTISHVIEPVYDSMAEYRMARELGVEAKSTHLLANYRGCFNFWKQHDLDFLKEQFQIVKVVK